MTTYNIWEVADEAEDLEEFYDGMTELEEPYDVAQMFTPDCSYASINDGEFYINPEQADKGLFLHKQGKKYERDYSVLGFRGLGFERHRDTEFEDVLDKKQQVGPFRGHDGYELGGKILGKLSVLGGGIGALGEFFGHDSGVIGGGMIAAGAGILYASAEYSWGANDALDCRIDEMVDQKYGEMVVYQRGEIPVNVTETVPGFQDDELEGEHAALKFTNSMLKGLDIHARREGPADTEVFDDLL